MLLQALHLLKQTQQSQLAKAETKIAHNVPQIKNRAVYMQPPKY